MSRKKATPDDFQVRPFDSLREMIEEKWNGLPEKPIEEDATDTRSDEELFRDAMSKVREIKEFREIPVEEKKIRPIRKSKDECEEALDMLNDIASGKAPINLSDTEEYVQWVNPEHQRFDTLLLHGGNYSVQDYIDLHGYTVAEAEEEIERYLKECIKKGFSCVKIIHGRGLRSKKGPVVKDAIVRRLSGNFRKNIIAFVSARQCDGGLGAVYVLLKRK
jgi:DNA-nicking Smr family endonuclease